VVLGLQLAHLEPIQWKSLSAENYG
jgi:hypothetical protein